MQFRLWLVLVTVVVSAGMMAELGQRRERLARLCIVNRGRADACFDLTRRICDFGEISSDIEAFYRRQALYGTAALGRGKPGPAGEIALTEAGIYRSTSLKRRTDMAKTGRIHLSQ
jgi:hypothetical protein